MSAYRDHSEVLIERLKNPQRAAQYLDVALEEFGKDGDLGAFLLALRRVAEAQGVLYPPANRSVTSSSRWVGQAGKARTCVVIDSSSSRSSFTPQTPACMSELRSGPRSSTS